MRKTPSGFTLVEVLIAVAIIGLLTTIGFVSFTSIQSNTRDSQRSSQMTVLAEALEKYYDNNGEYPSCAAMAQDPNTISTTTLPGIDPTVLTDPTATDGTNSILHSTPCADLTSGTGNFAYVGDGSTDCLTGADCLQFTLKYTEESTGDPKQINSRRVVSLAGSPIAPDAPTVSISIIGNTITPAINRVTCSVGTVEYGISKRINGTWSSWTTWNTAATTEVATATTASEGFEYVYKAKAWCYGGISSHSNESVGAESTPLVAPITTAPTPNPVAVTYSTTDYSTTNYSWDVVTCPSGTVARYQYRYTISPTGYDSGWATTAGTSFSPTTSTFGYRYTVAVRAQCYNNYSIGDWDNAGSTYYDRPVPNVQVLVVAGGGNGGSSTSDESGGGGGGGGVVWHPAKTVANQSYSIVVGGGGASNSASGQNSTFQDITALGGGGGGPTNENGYNGGSGGGGAGAQDGSTNDRGYATQGNSGGGTGYGYNGGRGQWRNNGKSGGGGGGAGMIGGDAYDAGGNGKMTGGNGFYSALSGSWAYYAGGGGGASCCYWGSGGAGGGGNGAQNGHGAAGAANTGGGGGGGGGSGGGNGGSGLVIIRYATSALGATGGTATTVGADTVRTFYSSGTFQIY